MNLFYLDEDPTLNAQYHVDAHQKMILEAVQLLCTTFHLQGIVAPYKKTHQNHPSAIWTRNSSDNFEWVIEYTTKLTEEFVFRSEHKNPHKSSLILEFVNFRKRDLVFPEQGFTEFALAMPEEYKVENPIESYRNYYTWGKSHLHKWTKREAPPWILQRLESHQSTGS